MTRNRRADWRRVKSLLSYTVDEAARTLNVHRGTVRYWIKKQGLSVLTDRRPHLILGRVLVAFLRTARQSRKKKCGRGELYCLKCRTPRKPLVGFLEYRRASSSRGVLVGLCEQCESVLRRFVSNKRAPSIAAEFGIQIEPHHESLNDSAIPALNCHVSEPGQI
jgi:excisionase family DNA binding protein